MFILHLGDNWNGIMKDTLRDNCDDEADCVKNCCVNSIIAPIFFVIFVLMAQFVLVNVVVAVLMKHLEESHKQIEDDEYDMEELEREMEQVQKFEEEQAMCMQLENDKSAPRRSIAKVHSVPSNFTYTSPMFENRFNSQRRQTLQLFNQSSRGSVVSQIGAEIELGEIKPKTKRRSSSISKDKEIASVRTPNARPKFHREISLDERQMMPKPTHKLIEMKRTSFDQLLLRDDKTTNFYHKSNTKPNDKSTTATANIVSATIGTAAITTGSATTKNIAEKKTSSKDSIVMAAENANVSLYRRSSLKNEYGHSNVAKERLQMSKAHSIAGRSGSCRQLFKQHAMDDEADIDENSLLLPVLNKPQIQHMDTKNAKETSLFNKTTKDSE